MSVSAIVIPNGNEIMRKALQPARKLEAPEQKQHLQMQELKHQVPSWSFYES